MSAARRKERNSRSPEFDGARRLSIIDGMGLTMSATRDPPFETEIRAAQHLLDERRWIEHERDALIAELGGAREAAHARKRFPERLDDDVLLPLEIVHGEPEAARAEHRDDDVLSLRRRRAFRQIEPEHATEP